MLVCVGDLHRSDKLASVSSIGLDIKESRSLLARLFWNISLIPFEDAQFGSTSLAKTLLPRQFNRFIDALAVEIHHFQ